MIRSLRDQLSFFTRMPVGSHADWQRLAEKQSLFPLTGFLIGLMIYFSAVLLSFSPFSPDLKAALLLVFLYSLTGILHLDGISDFFDGVAARGTPDEKIDAMMDSELGAAGVLSTFLFLILVFTGFEAVMSFRSGIEPLFFDIPHHQLFIPLVISEIAAKFGMNTYTFLALPVEKSSARHFLSQMNREKYLLAAIIPGFIMASLNPVLILPVLASQLAPIYLVKSGKKNFGGGNGDMIGASNETARIVCLLFILLL